MLQTCRNNLWKHSNVKNFVTFLICCTVPVVMLWHFPNDIYYSSDNFLNVLWKKARRRGIQSDATAILFVWASILLVMNIMEGVIVKYTVNSRNQSKKSLYFTSGIILTYILTLLFSVESKYGDNWLSGAILLMFLHEFIGIEKLYSEGGLDLNLSGKCLGCNESVCRKSFTICFCIIVSFFVMIPVYTHTKYYAGELIIWILLMVIFCIPLLIAMGIHCKQISMEWWYKLMSVICSISMIIVIVLMLTEQWDGYVTLYKKVDNSSVSSYSYSCVIIFLYTAPIINIISYMSLTLFGVSLGSLIKIQYSQDIINQKVLQSINQKNVRSRLYSFLLVTIIMEYSQRIYYIIYKNADMDTILKNDFSSDLSVLSLLSLILWWEWPTCNTYLKCTKCHTRYLKSTQCEICGKSTNSPKTLISIDSNVMNKKLLNNYYQLSSKSITASSPAINLEIVNICRSDVIILCNGENLGNCESFKRITTISQNGVFVPQCLEMFNVIYCGYNSLAALNDYIRNIHEYLYHNIEQHSDQLLSNQFAEEDTDVKYDENMDSEDERSDNCDNFSLNDNIVSYGFGSFIYYNLLKPQYTCFKDEMLNHVTIHEWNSTYEDAKELMKSNQAKKLESKKEQRIQIGDMLAIKFYTDLDQAQRAFRQSFRKADINDKDQDVIARHIDKYFFWGKWLNHAITSFGDKIDNEKISYYHGLSGKFTFSSLGGDFNIPISVTTEFIVAQRFAADYGNKNGIIMQLKCQWNYKSKWNRSKALCVEWISTHSSEKEVLLFGNFNQLMITNIYFTDDVNIHNNSHKIITETINNFERLCKGITLNKKYDTVQHTSLMKLLIEREVTNEAGEDYFGQVFHNVCHHKNEFTIKAFIQHQRKWNMLNWPNAFEILEQQLGAIHNVSCRECCITMMEINNRNYVCRLKCDCTANAVIKCRKRACEYKLCGCCADMIQMLRQILKNANHVLHIPEYDDMKFKAWRIEALQEKRLL
eukprot:379221_1